MTEEREAVRKENEDPEVEGHAPRKAQDGDEGVRSADEDDPDVEGHSVRKAPRK